MEGIRNGFRITDSGSHVQKVQVKNHKLAIVPQNKPIVEREIKTQIEQGNYILASKRPAIVIPIGAFPKASGLVWIIHDGSLPEGLAMNDYADLSCRLSITKQSKMHAAWQNRANTVPN